MKKFACFFLVNVFVLLCVATAHAQTQYSYDAAGNRIKRQSLSFSPLRLGVDFGKDKNANTKGCVYKKDKSSND